MIHLNIGIPEDGLSGKGALQATLEGAFSVTGFLQKNLLKQRGCSLRPF